MEKAVIKMGARFDEKLHRMDIMVSTCYFMELWFSRSIAIL